MSKARKTSATEQDVQAGYTRFQNDIQQLAEKIGELESDAEEHELVLTTLKEASDVNPDRKCFRLVGGILVERTVKEILPALQANRDGIRQVLSSLVQQYQKKDEEFAAFKREFGIAPMPPR